MLFDVLSRQRRFVFLLVGLFAAAGVWAALTLPSAIYPELNFSRITVVAQGSTLRPRHRHGVRFAAGARARGPGGRRVAPGARHRDRAARPVAVSHPLLQPRGWRPRDALRPRPLRDQAADLP